jgi:hypothetical protein
MAFLVTEAVWKHTTISLREIGSLRTSGHPPSPYAFQFPPIHFSDFQSCRKKRQDLK